MGLQGGQEQRYPEWSHSSPGFWELAGSWVSTCTVPGEEEEAPVEPVSPSCLHTHCAGLFSRPSASVEHGGPASPALGSWKQAGVGGTGHGHVWLPRESVLGQAWKEVEIQILPQCLGVWVGRMGAAEAACDLKALGREVSGWGFLASWRLGTSISPGLSVTCISAFLGALIFFFF